MSMPHCEKLIAMEFLLSLVFEQKIQRKRIRTIPEVPSDVMSLSFHFAERHFNAGLIGIGVNNNLVPFVHDHRLGSTLIKHPPDVDALGCRIHRHTRIG